VDYVGHPHSGSVHFEERYRRVDGKRLEVGDDYGPGDYTLRYVALTRNVVRADKQELE
jgi:hypothetical protein